MNPPGSHYDFSAARFAPVSIEEERVLSARAFAGDASARRRLVECNMRFVASVANRFRGKGMPVEDLISEGALGLCEAAKRYNPARDLRFITYGVWWIRQSIIIALREQTSTIHTPPMHTLTVQLKAARAAWEAAATEVAKDRAEAAMDTIQARIDYMVEARTPDSMEVLCELGREIPDQAFPADARALAGDAAAATDRLLSVLRHQDEELLRLYYGLDGTPNRTLDDVAAVFSITREGVRQRKAKSLRRLKRAARILKKEDRPC